MKMLKIKYLVHPPKGDTLFEGVGEVDEDGATYYTEYLNANHIQQISEIRHGFCRILMQNGDSFEKVKVFWEVDVKETDDVDGRTP